MAGGGAGGGGVPQEPLSVRSASGRTTPEAISRLEDELPAQVFYGAARLVIFGPQLLRHGAKEAVYAVARLHDLPWRAFVAGADDTAEGFLTDPGILQKKPLYSLFRSRADLNVALRPGYVYSIFSNASSPRLAMTIPVFSHKAGDVTLTGLAVLQDGREQAMVAAEDAALIAELTTVGPAVYRVDLPFWPEGPVILVARSVSAHVRTEPDGQVVVRLGIQGFVEERLQLQAAGHPSTEIAMGLGHALATRLAGVLVELRKQGVDPRAFQGQPWSEQQPLRLRVDVAVALDLNQQGP